MEEAREIKINKKIRPYVLCFDMKYLICNELTVFNSYLVAYKELDSLADSFDGILFVEKTYFADVVALLFVASDSVASFEDEVSP